MSKLKLTRNQRKHSLTNKQRNRLNRLEKKIGAFRNKRFELEQMLKVAKSKEKVVYASKLTREPYSWYIVMSLPNKPQWCVFDENEKFELWLLRRIQATGLYHELKELNFELTAIYKRVFEDKK